MNPWIIIGLIAFWATSIAGAFFAGESREADRAKAAQLTAVTQAVEDANRVAANDQRKAVAAAQKAAKAKTRTITIQGAAREVVREVPMPAVCDADPGYMRVLGDAIANANDIPQPSGVLLKPMSKLAGSGIK